MPDGPPTSQTLIARVQQREEGAWSRFIEVYGPAIQAFLRAKGLQDADLHDVSQEVLRGVAKGIVDWMKDERRATFRTWLFTITRRRLTDFWRRRQRHPPATGDSDVQRQLEAVEDYRTDIDIWHLEWERRLFHYAAQQVEHDVDRSTWRAFWLTAVDGRSPTEVARELDIRVGSVYVARSRVMNRLRDELRKLEAENPRDEV